MPRTHSVPQSRSYKLLGHIVTVVGAESVASLPEHLGELLGAGTMQSVASDHSTLVVHYDGAAWEVYDERGTLLCPPLQRQEQIAQFLEWLAYSAAIRHADVPLVLHAGAVTRRNAAVLLPNVSHSGKTTLTLALGSRGWLPLTDDVCPLVDVDGDLVAQKCQRCCHLRMPSQNLLDLLGVEMEGPLGGSSLYYRPRRWGRPAPVRAVVIPRYQADAPTSLAPISQGECLAQLAAMNFTESPRPGYERRRTAARLAAQVLAFRLTYSSLDEALDSFGILESQLDAFRPDGRLRQRTG